MGAREGLDELWRVDEEGKVALLLEKGVENIRMMEGGCEKMCIVLVG